MSLQACKCGCTVFETIRTVQYSAEDFYVDARSTAIRAEVTGIPIGRCLKCNRLIVPSTSMAGVSVLDPRVKAYAEVLKAVEYCNNTISDLDVYPSMIADVESKVIALAATKKIDEIKVTNMATGEVVEVVKTTNGGRKKLKPTVS